MSWTYASQALPWILEGCFPQLRVPQHVINTLISSDFLVVNPGRCILHIFHSEGELRWGERASLLHEVSFWKLWKINTSRLWGPWEKLCFDILSSFFGFFFFLFCWTHNTHKKISTSSPLGSEVVQGQAGFLWAFCPSKTSSGTVYQKLAKILKLYLEYIILDNLHFIKMYLFWRSY